LKKVLLLIILSLLLSFNFALGNSLIFFKGELPADMYVWPWGFLEDPAVVPGTGYTPGTGSLRWVTHDGGEWQGAFIGLNSNVGVDMASIWESDSVYFKIKAPNGLAASDTMYIWLYDSRNSDWDYASYYKLESFHDIDDGNWHQFSIALKEFIANVNDINKTDIVAVSFEASSSGIASEMYFDDVWIGDPDINLTMTLFNGLTVSEGVSSERWGFADNSFIIAEGEGYAPGTNAIVWENNTSDGPWDAGIGFSFNNQDFRDSWTDFSLKIKIKAPAGINDLALLWWDPNWNTATRALSDVTWNGEWQLLSIPLADFTVDEGFDTSRVYYFSIGPVATAIPERILITDIWTGDPVIDLIAPPAPENIRVDVSSPYVNLIAWDNIATENGETYNVYASLFPITDLGLPGVYIVAANVPEDQVAVHNVYYPLSEGEISYYYAVTCTDAAGNKSDTFGSTTTPFTNTGKKRAIISLDAPQNFVADGDFSDWGDIVPFKLNPARNLYWGNIKDSLDYSANCYVAMDNENLYIAFDVFDDVFSWSADNTVDWWEDECIEFYFGFYELGIPHSYFFRGAEPDYRLVFLPNELDLWSGEMYAAGTENYYFEALGESDYVIEAKIPFAQIQVAGDSTYTPKAGSIIPFEIFAADADVADGGCESRLQLGDNAALNPWGGGPEVWTFAWVGIPSFTSVEENNPIKVSSYYLGKNYPNPFNPTTTINYSIPKSSDVTLYVYNTLGQKVKTLVNAKQTAGKYTVNFDASNLASGIYFYQIKADNFTKVKKMVLIK